MASRTDSWFARAKKFVRAPHASPRYAFDRARLSAWQRLHPEAPWLSREAVEFLGEWLRPGDGVVEYGSGRSTVWFASRAAWVVSVEHDAEWHGQVKTMVAAFPNVTLHLMPEGTGGAMPYVGVAERGLPGRPNLVLVDGKYRAECALWALDHVASGGLVIVDNANWYLPGPSRAPSSIPPGGVPESPVWEAWWTRVAPLRRVWFSDGVTATLVVWAA